MKTSDPDGIRSIAARAICPSEKVTPTAFHERRIGQYGMYDKGGYQTTN
jgi:hypothetical protein